MEKYSSTKITRSHKQIIPWVYVSPSLFLLIILSIGPMIFLYFISMTNYDLGTPLSSAKFIGFDNFIRLFSGKDREFWPSIRVTTLLSITATLFELILGFIIALFLNSIEKFKGSIISIIMLPMVITPVIVGLLWKLMLNNDHGIINWIIMQLGLNPPAWLSSQYSLLSVLIVEIWQWTPFVTLILLSGLTALPIEPLEASSIDGATYLDTLIYIIIPIMRPIILLAVLFRLIDVIKIFDIVFVLTGGGPGSATETLSIHAYRLGFYQTGWIGRASATGVILAIIATVASFYMIKFLQENRRSM